jgi:cobalamin 5''-phosphate synthase/cobalamin synthase
MKYLAAAFVFFTRLPFWKLKVFNVPLDCFREAINYWAVTGWLTAGIMSAVLWLSAQILPYSVAVILALLSRVLLTGALHEDGLADFMDGFGGGQNKERILAIMKDSHIGTYGVIGLLFYFLLLFEVLSHLPLGIACVMILIADPFCKFISAQIVLFLPYARTAESSKSKVVYNKTSSISFFVSGIFGLAPLVFIPHVQWLAALLFPVVAFLFLTRLMRRKIGGYTGDCCGALFLLCELSLYTGIFICLKNFPL